MTRRHRFWVLVFFTLPLFGELIDVFPAAPTTATPVTIRTFAPCGGRSHTLARAGNVITITVQSADSGVCDAFAGTPYDVPAGTLPAGLYRVNVLMLANTNRNHSREFVVRNATPPFDVHPWTISVTSLPARAVLTNGTRLCTTDCATVSVLVDGIAATNIDTSNGFFIRFTPPARPPGLYDVELRRAAGTIVSPAALYYFHPAAPADLSVFEPVLFPLMVHSEGAFDSVWISEAVILNPKPWPVQNYNTIQELSCRLPPCERLRPGHNEKLLGQTYATGVNLLVPRSDAPSLSFALRARDISKTDHGFGTEIPVVRERDLGESVTLLNVPIDPRYRTLLRIYAVEGIRTAGAFEVVVQARSRLLFDSGFTMTATLKRDCNAVTCAETPAYFAMTLPAGLEGEEVDIYIQPFSGLSLWAFAAVTNNDTQQVTVVTPNGDGGTACYVCPPE